MGHVDALSRHVGPVAQDVTLDRESILREQEVYAFCSKLSPGTYHGRKEFFLDSDGIFYRRRSNGIHQLVVPATLEQAVMKENHAPLYIAHPGTKRTHDLIALQYWWPGMKAVEKYVRSCDPCQRKKKSGNLRPPSGPSQSQRPRSK
jgi:hypothetical protein